MAQVRGGRLGRRYGIEAGRAVALVLAALVAAVALGAVAVRTLGTQGQGVQVERADEGAETASVEEDPLGEATEGDAQESLWVHVDGAVLSPGVYRLPADARANDAVEAAGGLVEGADTSSVNLAAPLSDGEKLHVPYEGESAQAGQTGSEGSSASVTGGLVNINTATEEELCSLPGIGEATAAAIVLDRQTSGPFSTIEDLMRVSGIGEKKFAKLESMICV